MKPRLETKTDMRPSVEQARVLPATSDVEQFASSKKTAEEVVVASIDTSKDEQSDGDRTSVVPLKMKIIAILLVTATGFGSHWSSGVTGAMKSTLKKVCEHYNPFPVSRLTSSSSYTSTTRNTLCLKLARTS
jgi:hypothetical protein